eukprot:TRINITY_DN24731_c0_g1_i1.p1 TRINITY_DN24731_c0_g1~~TRINITY_DN24731_c0_g1_i1.p1  ORF type:complete len:440 (+),score=111.78 TRINITY_DN24731_c0_g1_i1:80-1399(+)
MLDSLYGNLLGGGGQAGSKNAPATAGATRGSNVGSAGPGPAQGPQGPPTQAASAPSGRKSDDDIFSEPPGAARLVGSSAASNVATSPATAAAQMQSKIPANKSQDQPSTMPLPQAFSAAKLMMPPVRKKAEPMASKRPMIPLDISKLQEEKEALMRQKAAASEKPPTSSSTASGLGDAGGDDSSSVPATASTAPVGASNLASVQTSSSTLSGSLYGSPDEEYDPAKPNDYDEFCRRRMRQKAEEEMEKRRQEALARQQAATKAAEPKEDDYATKMMKKMGWKEGGGLGKDNQGMTTPLVLQKTDKVTGKIVEGVKREAPAAQGQPEAKHAKAGTSTRPPTRVLLLNNLVGAGEVDEDLEEETAEEASKYGKIRKCVIKEIKGVPDDQAVRIFLQYERSEDATKALVDMNGRYFGGRVVRARFFDEDRFAKGDLDRRTDE